MIAPSTLLIADRLAEKIVKSKIPLTVYVTQSGEIRCSKRTDLYEIPAFRIVGTYRGSDLGFLGVNLHEDLTQTLAGIEAVRGGIK